MWPLHVTAERFFIVFTFLVVLTMLAVIVAENEDISRAFVFRNLPVEAGTSVLDIRGEVARTAEELAREVRVLCLVMTHPGNHKTKALKVY